MKLQFKENYFSKFIGIAIYRDLSTLNNYYTIAIGLWKYSLQLQLFKVK